MHPLPAFPAESPRLPALPPSVGVFLKRPTSSSRFRARDTAVRVFRTLEFERP
jgi:hypothetical protein